MAALVGAGLLALVGGRTLRETYTRWNYPDSYRYGTGAGYRGGHRRAAPTA